MRVFLYMEAEKNGLKTTSFLLGPLWCKIAKKKENVVHRSGLLTSYLS